MRVSQIDKRRAIWRLPEFQTDYNLYNSLEAEERIRKEIELASKWGFSVESIKQADTLATQKRNSPAIREVSSISRNPIVKFVKGKGETKNVFFRGDYLYLEIDIQRPNKELQNEFLKIIKKYKSKLPVGRKAASKIRSTTFDIWDIYDFKHKHAKNQQEIIVSVYGKHYCVSKFQKRYEKIIERAIKKADDIIVLVKQKIPLIDEVT